MKEFFPIIIAAFIPSANKNDIGTNLGRIKLNKDNSSQSKLVNYTQITYIGVINHE